jgi:hypothetical protein
MTKRRKTRPVEPHRGTEPRGALDTARPAATSLLSWAPVVLAIVVALAMRLWALRYQPIVTVDGTDYLRFAEALARNVPFPSIFPPGYPALVLLARMLVPDPVAAGQVVSIACGTLLPLPVWWLARPIAGPWWAGLPALAVALHPELARFGAVTMSESAFILLLHVTLCFAASRRPAASGLALGAAFAVRPEALVTAAALAVREVVRVAREKTSLQGLAFGAAGFLVLAVPCWIYFHATLGAWTLTPKIGALHATTTDWRLDERRLSVAPPGEKSRGAVAILIENGPVAVQQYPSNARAHARSLHDLWPAPLLLLSLIGIVRRRGIESVPLIALAVLPLLGLSRQPRFVLAAVPALAILAMIPLASAGRKPWRAAGIALWVAGAVWCGVARAKAFRTPLDGSFEHHKAAGLWLGGASNPGDVVLDRKPYVAFYSKRRYRVMPDEPYENLIRYAVRSGIRYLVVDQKVAAIFRKQLEPLLYDRAFREREHRLELIYVGGLGLGHGVGIYRVLGPHEAKTGRPPVVEADYVRGVRRDAAAAEEGGPP